MRIFIGMKPDADAIEKIQTALKPFKKIASPIKWVKPGNWHFTLKFIGEVSAEKKNQIIETLRKTQFDFQPFEIVISGFGKFGQGNELNIFWAGIAENETLKKVYAQIEKILEEIEIPGDTREPKPHLTLGRNRKRFNFKPFFSMLEKDQSEPIARFISRGFQIFQSVLTPDGPVYSILEEVAFSHV